ncbi:MAG: preprotein translocase subunit SecG [Ignavibacteria bacterium]|nr:preprotein translocase subunit SecG [Ignavibacteria bacterium]
MYALFIVVEIIIAVLLMIVILMQASKGGGLAGTFGGGNIGSMFGVRRTSDFLSKTTTILATAFLILALFINIFILPTAERTEQSVIQSVPSRTALPPPPAESTPPPRQ